MPPRILWVSTLGLAAAFLWSYWPNLVEIVRVWNSDPDYSHGYLVVPLAGLFLWVRRDRFQWDHSGPAWGGAALIAAAILLRYLSDRFYLYELASWSMVPWIAGACWLIGGRPFFRWTLPSVVFLLFAMKMPLRLETALSGPLRRIATETSCWLMQFFGLPAFPEGNTIVLNDHRLEVADACAGLRMSLGIIAMAYAFCLLTSRPLWQKIALALSAVPVAIAANTLRIVVTGYLYEHVSGESAEKFMHDISGILMIPVAAGLFAAVLWLLGKLTVQVELTSHRTLAGPMNPA